MTNTYEPLYIAVRGLATGANTIQARLHSAYLAIHTLTDFPTPELRDQFTSIAAALTCVEGSALATVRMLTDEEATQVAQDIFDLFIDVARLHMREPT